MRGVCWCIEIHEREGSMSDKAENLTIAVLISKASEKLRQEFEYIRETNIHNGEMGGETEEKVRDFLNKLMPKRFQATAGFVIDVDNQMSNHQDVIIYDAMSSPSYRYEENNQIVSSDAVASIIEVKSVLNKSHLENGYQKIAEVKRLRKRPMNDMDQKATESDMTTTGTLGIILGFTSDISLEKIAEHCVELNEKYDSAHIPNLIVVVDVGTINYTAEFVGGGKTGDLAPTGDDEFVIPPCYVHLVARKDGAFAINRLFTHLISHLAFFPRRPSIPPFNVLLEGTSSVQQHVGLYQYNTERRLIPFPMHRPPKEPGQRPNPVLKIRDRATKKELATMTYIPWQDGGVIRKKGDIPLIGLLVWFTKGSAPHTMKVKDHELSTVMKVTREEFEKWPEVINRQSNLLAQLEEPFPFEARQIEGMEGTAEPFISRIMLGVMELAKSLSQTEKTEFDERYSATLDPALQMRNAYRNIRDTIRDHKAALANRSIVRKSVDPEPLLTERIDTQLRNSTNLFLEMAHQALQGIPVTMKFFKINIDFLMDNEKRFAIGCEKYEAKIPEVVAYLRKLRPIWIDLNEQFKKQRFGSWTLPAVRYDSHDNVVTMSEPQVEGKPVTEYIDGLYSVVSLAIEELVAYGFQSMPDEILAIAEIPLGQRNPNVAERFKRTMRGYEPLYELKWTGRSFYES